jgi:hypothetical protein
LLGIAIGAERFKQIEDEDPPSSKHYGEAGDNEEEDEGKANPRV